MEDSRQCIPLVWICNGQADCPMGSDEQNCCESYNMRDCTTFNNISFCAPESLLCKENTCMQYEKTICEAGIFMCSVDEFMCHLNEMCISLQSVCDGTPQCPENEDELFCHGRFLCGNLANNKMQNSLQYVIDTMFYFPEGNVSNTRQNCVFVPGVASQFTSVSEPHCLLESHELQCSTLDCVLSTIINHHMFWIDSLYINGFMKRENQTIFIPHKTSARPRKISIICLDSCVLNNSFTIFAMTFQRSLVIELESLWFHNCTLSVGNVHLLFKKIYFVDSLLTEHEPARGDLGQLELHFSNIKFNCKSGISSCGLTFKNVFTLSIFLLRSKLTNIVTLLNVPNLFFDIGETTFVGGQVMLENTKLSFLSLQNILFTEPSPISQKFITLKITGYRIDVTFTNCVFENTGGLELVQKDSEVLDSWIKFDIQNCTFYQCVKFESGGALSLTFIPPHTSLSKSLNFIKITNSTFMQNGALKFGKFVSQGGALHISSQKIANTCFWIQVEIVGSKFINNKATDGGGALFTSGECVNLKIINSVFEITDIEFDSTPGAFIIAHSQVSIISSILSRVFKGQSSSLVELEMLSQMTNIRDFDILLQCPEWYKASLKTKFVQFQVRKLLLACKPCPVSFYVSTEGHFLISLVSNESDVYVEDSTTKAIHFNCLPCPAGAHCPGNDLTASPNFWGLRSDSEIAMYPCPVEYCCAECTSYNQCSGHRTGMLCGSCEQDYSLSLLSSECIHKSSCNDHWLWPMAVLVMFLYVCWYTFKDDVLTIPARWSNIIQKVCSRKACKPEQNNIDKGYFGIVTNFVQVKALWVIPKPNNNTRVVYRIFHQIESYIQLVLNFELNNISHDSCDMQDITATRKTMLHFVFFFGVYFSWNLAFLCVLMLEWCAKVFYHKTCRFENTKIKLISGLIEILKYTYLGLTSIVFYSLVCMSVAGNWVWFYDGSVKCYSKWQVAMIIFGLTYVLPYPLLIGLGMKMIIKKRISIYHFFVACCFPLPFVVCWLFVDTKQQTYFKQQNENQTSHQTSSKMEKAICDGIRGGFRESKHGTQYWESVLMFRRLFTSVTILVPNPSTQLSLCFTLCVLSLLHHAYRNPFVHSTSNKAETLSLSLLCGIAAINFNKASYLYTNINPNSLQANLMRNLELFEAMSVLVLIAFIVAHEMGSRLQKFLHKSNLKQVQVLKVSAGAQAHTRFVTPTHRATC